MISNIKVEFIVSMYDRVDLLRCMLSSLIAQYDKDWIANVVIDNPPDKVIDNIVNMIDSLNEPRIEYTTLDKRYNNWGHTPREIGKQSSTEDYIIMTNHDNYYTPNFVAELKKASVNKPGMVYWDMVHSHYNYQYFKCKPIINEIDMGAFATRRDLAQQITLGTSYAADGEFVRDFCKKFPRENKIKIEKVLFVHN